MLRSPCIVGLAIVMSSLAGCGDSSTPTYPVSGRVRLADGTAVETGVVEFSSADGTHTVRGEIDRKGHFSFAAVAGEHRAVVIQLIVTEDLPLHEHDHGPTLHPDFAHYRRSGLSFAVKPEGENDFDVVVQELDASRNL